MTIVDDGRPNPSAPVVCRIRLRYAKRGKLRFTSSRDVARSFERALRKAKLPMGYSQGFSPHPKISWIGAAPTGTASEAEYVEIGLTTQYDPHEVRELINESLPDGIEVLDAVAAAGGGLAERIEACRWLIRLDDIDVTALGAAVDALLAEDEVLVRRRTKKGMRDVDVRPQLVSVTVTQTTPESLDEFVSDKSSDPYAQVDTGVRSDTPAEVTAAPRECGILDVVVRQSTPTVRPDDVLSALRVVADLRPPVPAIAIRLAQGRLDDGVLADPLTPDRGVKSTAESGEAAASQARS